MTAPQTIYIKQNSYKLKCWAQACACKVEKMVHSAVNTALMITVHLLASLNIAYSLHLLKVQAERLS